MQAKIETLKAKNGADEEYLVYPRTLIQCVTNENGDNLEDTLKDFVATEFSDTYASSAEVSAIKDGTTQVGNAKSLDGHGAEYFGKSSEVTVRSDQRDKETNHTEYANKLVFVGLKINTSINLLNSGALYSYVFGLMGYETTGGGNAHELAFNNSGIYHRQVLNDNSKTEWEKLFTTDGGVITTPQLTPLEIDSTGSDARVLLAFSKSGVKQGWLGFNGVNTPVFYSQTLGFKELLHTGNKPTGTYTGNGDDTERTINVGGLANGVIIATSDYGGMALVTQHGAICKTSDGTTVSGVPWGEIGFDGRIILKTTNPLLNASGVLYKYISF